VGSLAEGGQRPPRRLPLRFPSILQTTNWSIKILKRRYSIFIFGTYSGWDQPARADHPGERHAAPAGMVVLTGDDGHERRDLNNGVMFVARQGTRWLALRKTGSCSGATSGRCRKTSSCFTRPARVALYGDKVFFRPARRACRARRENRRGSVTTRLQRKKRLLHVRGAARGDGKVLVGASGGEMASRLRRGLRRRDGVETWKTYTVPAPESRQRDLADGRPVEDRRRSCVVTAHTIAETNLTSGVPATRSWWRPASATISTPRPILSTSRRGR